MTRSQSIALLAFALFGMLVFGACKQDDRPFVVSKIQKAAKLATCETTIDKIVLATEQKRIIKWLGGRKQAVFLAYSQATVKTGIDLDKLAEDDIVVKEKSISIDLPPVEVLNFSYPSETFKIDTMITQRTLYDNITIEEQEEAIRVLEEQLEETRTVLRKTEQQVEELITEVKQWKERAEH